MREAQRACIDALAVGALLAPMVSVAAVQGAKLLRLADGSYAPMFVVVQG
jgi:hypothetical protein